MGQERQCSATIDGRRGKGQALLETDDLVFRSPDLRVKIPDKSIREVRDANGKLHVTYERGTATFDLGADAAKWAERIRSPKSRIDKLGVKADQRVAVIGVRDTAFDTELRGRTRTVTSRLGP